MSTNQPDPAERSAARAARTKVFIPPPSDEEKVRLGLAWLSRQLGQPGANGVIVVLTVGHITTTDFAGAIGLLYSKQVARDRQLILPTERGRMAVPVLTSGGRRLIPSNTTDALLIYPTEDVLAAVGDFGRRPNICAIAWSDRDADMYLSKYGFIALGEKATRKPVHYPLAHAALISLTQRINTSTGLSHPSDKAAFDEMLHLLRDEGESIDPDFVTNTLIQLGLDPGDAQAAGKRAKQFVDGARFRRPRPSVWADNIVQLWRTAWEH